MNTLRDMRYALRTFAQRPMFAIQALITIAIGIAANTVVFTMVNSVLLRGLEFRDPARLVWIWSTRTDRDKAFFCIPDYVDFRQQTRTLADMTAFANWGANLTDTGDPERLQGVRITANAFRMLGVNAALGRVLHPGDGAPGSVRTAVLGYGLWQRRFGSDPSIAGKRLTLNGDSYTIVGVLPRTFIFPGAVDAEIAVPLVLETDARRSDRALHFLRVFARLQPGSTDRQAASEMDAITKRLRLLYPNTNVKNTAPRVIPLQDEIVGSYRRILLTLFLSVVLVMAIACSNLANLVLARNSARRAELGIRTALGASRWQLIRQLLTESMLLAVAGGLLGLLLTVWALKSVAAWAPSDLPRAREIVIDGSVLAFTTGLSVAAGLLFGLFPAFRGTGLLTCVRVTSTSRTRNFIVISEMVLSVLLLITSGLFLKSFVKLQAIDPGLDTSNLLLVRLSPPVVKYKNADAMTVLYEQIAERVRRLPGVESMAAASLLPLSNMNARSDFIVTGHPPLVQSEIPGAQNRSATPGYFRTMRIPMLQGREFEPGDNSGAKPVAIIDRELAKMHFGNRNPVGAHLTIDPADAPLDVEIVGVAGSVKHFELADEPLATIYRPISQLARGDVALLAANMSLVVRTTLNPLTLGSAVRRELQAVDKDMPAGNTRSMDQFLSASVAPRRFSLTLLASFALAALLLASTGLYAVVSYSVNQRAKEMGIRIALGASRRQIVHRVLFEAMRLALLGTAVGLVLAAIVARLITSELFGVAPIDPLTFILVPLLMIAVGAVASLVPATRAARTDPIVSLGVAQVS